MPNKFIYYYFLGIFFFKGVRKVIYNNNGVKEKVNNLNGIFIREQPWIGGNYLIKRETVIDLAKLSRQPQFWRSVTLLTAR